MQDARCSIVRHGADGLGRTGHRAKRPVAGPAPNCHRWAATAWR